MISIKIQKIGIKYLRKRIKQKSLRNRELLVIVYNITNFINIQSVALII
jgi:hypothetical protein